MLTEHRFEDKKKDYGIYLKEVTEDRYGNDAESYPTEPNFTIHCMWQPISSELEITQYGERVNEMLCTFIYSSEVIPEKSRVLIDGIFYNIISCIPWLSYRKLLVERVR